MLAVASAPNKPSQAKPNLELGLAFFHGLRLGLLKSGHGLAYKIVS
jgi:hypothetical protein